MSDQYYQVRAQRQRRIIIITLILVVVVLCSAVTFWTFYYDDCTGSLNRDPVQVARSYLNGLQQGNITQVRKCWRLDPYYNVNSGCSEICLSRVAGHPYEIQTLTAGEPHINQNNRAVIDVTITIACPNTNQSHTGILRMDTIKADAPWKHWSVISSTIGGTYLEPWCP